MVEQGGGVGVTIIVTVDGYVYLLFGAESLDLYLRSACLLREWTYNCRASIPLYEAVTFIWLLLGTNLLAWL